MTFPPSTLKNLCAKKQKQSYGPRRSTTDKLANVFNAIRDANWTLGEFLYYTFHMKDNNEPVFPAPVAMVATRSTPSRA